MSGFLQRLLDRGPGAGAAPQAVGSLVRSLSPLAEHDQRLQNPAFRGLAGLLGGEDEWAAPIGPEVPPLQAPEHTAPRTQTAAPAETIGKTRRERPVSPPENPIAAAPAPTPVFDPIKALRAQDATPSADPAPKAEPPQVATPPAAKAAPAPSVPADAQVSPPVTRTVERHRPPEPAHTSPPASFDAPHAMPDVKPAFWPTDDDFEPSREGPVQSDLPEPAPARLPEPANPVPAPGVQAVHPPRPAGADLSGDPVTSEHDLPPEQPVRERVIERVVERVEADPAQPRPANRPGPVTAESVSKIGALPTRRRVHTIFGLRRDG